MITATVGVVRVGLHKYLGSWRSDEALDVIYLGLYGINEAVLAPLAVWDGLTQRLAQEMDKQAAGVRERLDHLTGPQPTTTTIGVVRTNLYKYLDSWRSGEAVDVVYLGHYGRNEAVLAPLVVWNGLIQRLAQEMDKQAAAGVRERLNHGAGPQPTTILELARLTGAAGLPVQVLQKRGMPRGSADLAVWIPALSEIKALAEHGEATLTATLRHIGEIVLGRAPDQPSAAGDGIRYAVCDVDGFHAVVLTYRPAPQGRRSYGRRGLTNRPVVELLAVDVLRWHDDC
ncbi:hypothetical protein [Micromonospora sediminicola]|uniref:hypothetical protein n=1 Tax=Micromonospora sediminicola TaxID=946078 RepID=UPI00378ED472